MKSYVLSILFLLASWSSHAQLLRGKKNGGEKQLSFLFADAGVSVPVGYITDSKYNFEHSASFGPVLSLGYTGFFSTRWGMGLAASGSMYQGKALSDTYYNNYSAGYWQKGQAYIHGSCTPFLKDRWAVDVIQGFGTYFMKQPEVEYTLKDSNIKQVRNEKSGWDLGFTLGARGRALIKDRWGLMLSANYFYAVGLQNAVGFNSFDAELGLFMKWKK